MTIERRRMRFMSLLKTADCEAKFRKLKRLRHPGSGDWLLQQHAYRVWRNQEGCQTLYVYGIRTRATHLVLKGMYQRLTVETSGLWQECAYVRRIRC